MGTLHDDALNLNDDEYLALLVDADVDPSDSTSSASASVVGTGDATTGNSTTINPAAAAAAASDASAATNGSSSRKRKTRDGEEEEEPNGLGVYMMITEEERQWALTLKEALKENEETRDIPLTDMSLVQYGIVEGGNIEKAMERIRKMDEFRQKYDIQDSVEDGVECVREFIEQQPGMLLNVDLCARHKHYVQVMDFSRFHPGRIQFDKDWKVFLSGMHYLMVSLHPTLSAVRNGLVGICEFDGMGWHNFDMDFERRIWHEHPTAYPARWHEISWVNTPTAANMLFALLKPIMPTEIRRVFHLGVKFDEEFDGRLDELFLQPNYEVATRRVLSNVRSFLTSRYHNEARFKL